MQTKEAEFDTEGRPIVNEARWRAVAAESDPWKSRYERICAHIRPGESVVEYGCGVEAIRTLLPAGCAYQPTDVTPRSPDCIVLDLLQRSPASVGGHYDVAVYAGVLEYLPDPVAILAETFAVADRVIFSYASRDNFPKPRRRRRYGWCSHLSLDDWRAGAARHGMRLTIDQLDWRGQHILQAGRIAA